MASRKRKRDLQDDYSAGIEGEISKSMGKSGAGNKNTIDSDEEEDVEDLNKKKHDVLDAEEIEGIEYEEYSCPT